MVIVSESKQIVHLATFNMKIETHENVVLIGNKKRKR